MDGEKYFGLILNKNELPIFLHLQILRVSKISILNVFITILNFFI